MEQFWRSLLGSTAGLQHWKTPKTKASNTPNSRQDRRTLGQQYADTRRRQRMRVIFDKLDGEHKGHLTRADILEHAEHPAQVLERISASLDSDSDGIVTFEEFAAAFKDAPLTLLVSDDAVAVISEYGTRISTPVVGATGLGAAFPPLPITNSTTLAWYLQACVGTEVVTRTLMAPLERLHVDPRYYHGRRGPLSFLRSLYVDQGGLRGLRNVYQGHLANLLRVIPSSLTSCYVIVSMLNQCENPYGLPERAAIGTAAGLVSTLMWRPLDVIRLRVTVQRPPPPPPPALAVEVSAGASAATAAAKGGQCVAAATTPSSAVVRGSNGFLACARQIYREGRGGGGTPLRGAANFYQGLVPALGAVVPWYITYMVVFAHLKTWSNPLFEFEYYLSQIMACACAGAAAATVIAQPFENIQQHMAVSFLGGNRSGEPALKFRSGAMRQAAATLYQNFGLRGFFAGLGVGVARAVPSMFIAVLVREEYISYLKHIHRFK